MRTIVLLIIIFSLLGCNSKKEDQGAYIGIRDKNGDTLSLSYFNSGNEDYEFYDSDLADSLFKDKTILSEMPGRFVFGVKNKKGKPYRYLMFGKADSVIKIGKNYLDVSPGVEDSHTKYYPLPNKLFYKEYYLRNFVLRLVGIRYDTTKRVIREYQRLAAIDKNSKDTIMYQEEVFLIVKGENEVVGGTFAVFDSNKTLKQMKELCDNTFKKVMNSMKRKPN